MAAHDFPLKQGGLDFLCGVYAAINAMHLRGEISELDQAAIPFRLALMFMQSKQDWDLAQAVCFGVDEGDYRELLKNLSWRDWDHTWDPTEHKIEKALDELANKSCASIIVSIVASDAKAHENKPQRDVLHYTVVTGATPEGLSFYDSHDANLITQENGQLCYEEEKAKIGSLFVMRAD